ncbi:hypothetical protein BJ085DRAFT_40124, partial [Dimargaris cristalligena]
MLRYWPSTVVRIPGLPLGPTTGSSFRSREGRQVIANVTSLHSARTLFHSLSLPGEGGSTRRCHSPGFNSQHFLQQRCITLPPIPPLPNLTARYSNPGNNPNGVNLHVAKGEFLRTISEAATTTGLLNLYDQVKGSDIGELLYSPDHRRVIKALLQLYLQEQAQRRNQSSPLPSPRSRQTTPEPLEPQPASLPARHRLPPVVSEGASLKRLADRIEENLLHWLGHARGINGNAHECAVFQDFDYNSVVYTLIKLGRLERAWEVFQSASLNQVALTPQTILVFLLANRGRADLRTAQRVAAYGIAHQIILPITGYNLLLETFYKRNSGRDLESLHGYMVKHAVALDDY